MRMIVMTAALLATATAAFAQAAPDTAGARVPVEHYLAGHATGDGAHFRMAFAPQSSLYWIAGDTLSTRTSAQYIAGARGTPPADEAKRKRWIESIDVAGNAGIAKVILDYPTARFVDYLSLLKINGEWKIINKTFYVEPRN